MQTNIPKMPSISPPTPPFAMVMDLYNLAAKGELHEQNTIYKNKSRYNRKQVNDILHAAEGKQAEEQGEKP